MGYVEALSWSEATGLLTLTTLGGSRSAAYAINDAGQVAGMSLLAGDALTHACLWLPNMPPVLTLPGNTFAGVAGLPVTFTATATDPNTGDTLTFSLDGAPADATIDPATGLFTWTPPAAGTFTFDVKVTDAGGLSDTESVTVEVAVNQPPTLVLPATAFAGYVGTPVVFTASATDPDVGDALTFGLDGAPADAAIDPKTGEFVWTPTAPGAFAFDVTVTDVVGNSCAEQVTVNVSAAPEVVGVTPSGDFLPIDTVTTLTSVYRDLDGYSDLRRCYVLVCEKFSQANAMFLWYDRVTNKVFLKSDDNKSWGRGYTPGADITLSNSQCEVYVKDITVTPDGNDLTVVWSFKLKSSMTNRNLVSWMYVTDCTGMHDGWQKVGTHFIETPPVCVSVTPSSGSVQIWDPLVFTTEYSDDNGYSNIYQCYFQIGETGNMANTVCLLYDAKQGKVFLRNDQNTNWGIGEVPGTGTKLVNSQCIVYVEDIRVTPSGSSNLIIEWKILLSSARPGQLLGERMYCRDFKWLNSAWKLKGYVRAQ